VWGSKYNQNKFMSSLDCFVHLQRSETLSLHQLCQGYQLSHIPWILKSSTISLQYRLLMDLIDWIFHDFIISLLAANFYVTEGEGTGTETLYYKKKDWRLLEEIGMIQMNSNFMKVSHSLLPSLFPPHLSFLLQTLSTNPLNPPLASHQDGGQVISSSQVSVLPLASQDPSLSSSMFIPSVRFVPKKSSMRAITNMKRSHSHPPTDSLNSGQPLRARKLFSSIHLSPTSTLPNSSLYNCLYVLRHLSREIDSSRGFGVDGPEEAYSILRRYLHGQRLLRNCHQDHETSTTQGQGLGLDSERQTTEYYFAVLDLEKCFDSVDTARLYDLLVLLLDRTCRSHLTSLFIVFNLLQ
jgi:hypothetical protein